MHSCETVECIASMCNFLHLRLLLFMFLSNPCLKLIRPHPSRSAPALQRILSPTLRNT